MVTSPGLFARIRTTLFGQPWALSIVVAIVIALVEIGYYGLSSEKTVAHFISGLMLCGACLIGGALIGFLFGIPRSLQSEGPAPAKATKQKGLSRNAKTIEDRSKSRAEYRANTNLEQVSDWLTKILVGVGLTQINSVPNFLVRAGAYFGSSIGEPPYSEKIAVTIVLFFPIAGFMLGYLWTRIYLGGELARADGSG
jgi:hypothetical protein